MIRNALQTSEPASTPAEAAREEHIAPAPRVSIQAFCETVETAAAIQSAGEDRRLGKAHLKVQMGGVTAAIEAYRGSPTPGGGAARSEGHHQEPRLLFGAHRAGRQNSARRTQRPYHPAAIVVVAAENVPALRDRTSAARPRRILGRCRGQKAVVNGAECLLRSQVRDMLFRSASREPATPDFKIQAD